LAQNPHGVVGPGIAGERVGDQPVAIPVRRRAKAMFQRDFAAEEEAGFAARHTGDGSRRRIGVFTDDPIEHGREVAFTLRSMLLGVLAKGAEVAHNGTHSASGPRRSIAYPMSVRV